MKVEMVGLHGPETIPSWLAYLKISWRIGDGCFTPFTLSSAHQNYQNCNYTANGETNFRPVGDNQLNDPFILFIFI